METSSRARDLWAGLESGSSYTVGEGQVSVVFFGGGLKCGNVRSGLIDYCLWVLT